MDAQFHRVTHGGKFDQCHICAGNQPHVQKMLAQSSLSAHSYDPCGLADLKRIQSHCFLLQYHIRAFPLLCQFFCYPVSVP